MNYFSTNNKAKKYSFQNAVMLGLAPDGGLFQPERIPQLKPSIIKGLKNLSFQEIGYEISKLYIENEINNNEIQNIVEKSISFPAPLINLNETISVLELFYGPTLAFKDFGARFLANTIAYFANKTGEQINILVATSGDTGSAVAHGFYGINGVNVFLLYPSNKVSKIQEMQLTTLNKNIIALEVDGTFDDCQAMVKKAFVDEELNSEKKLSSANSINIARLIPQSFYYFEAAKQIDDDGNNICFSVPSGNLGNLTAGLLAKKMGLKTAKFISALNINDVFAKYLTTGNFQPRPSIKTVSNAMDVGNPSNLTRIKSLFDELLNLMNENIVAYSFTDTQTIQKIKNLFDQTDYVIDPHGAVGYLAAEKYIKSNQYINEKIIVLETAHPAKFLDVVEKAIAKKIEIPERLKLCLSKEKKSIKISNKYSELKEFILSN